MQPSELVVWIRAGVLAGAVLFGFALLASGFYFVWREYRLVNTFDKLARFIELTKSAKIDVDVAQGAFTLARTRPGLVMMAFGMAILLASLFVRLELSVTRGARDNSPIPAATPDNNVPHIDTGSAARVYDTWLQHVDELERMSPLELGPALATLAPGKSMRRLPLILRPADTYETIGSQAYGNSAYGPLVKATNPALGAGPPWPSGTTATLWYVDEEPLSDTIYEQVKIKIAGEDPKTPYFTALELIQSIVESPEFRANPDGYWASHNAPLGLSSFLDGLGTYTGYSWALRPYETVKGDTPGVLARAELGDARFTPFLALANPGHSILSRGHEVPDELLTVGEQIWLAYALSPR
ncbi:MAG: hypothetical protein ACKVXR_04845 [Planctomycetota bacterium]